MPSTNFLQINPSQANQLSDAQYLTDTTRLGGAAVDGIWSSPTANKMLYNMSTFIAAFAQMLVAKGFSPYDSNVNSLAGLLANVLTTSDNVAQVVWSYDAISQSSNLGITPGFLAAGLYRISVALFMNSLTGTSTYYDGFEYVWNGITFNSSVIAPSTSPISATNKVPFYGSHLFYCDGATSVNYDEVWTSGGGSDTFDIHIRLESLP